MTLALPKVGLRAPEVAPHVGELYLADISVPPGLYAKPPLDLPVGPLFAKEDIIHRLEPLTKMYFHKFHKCRDCDRIYWQGSHKDNMLDLLRRMGVANRKDGK